MMKGAKVPNSQQANPMVGNLFTNMGSLGGVSLQKGGDRGGGASTNIGGKKMPGSGIPSLQGGSQTAGNYHPQVHSTTNKGQTRGGRSFSRATDGGVMGSGSAGLASPKNYRTIYNSNQTSAVNPRGKGTNGSAGATY